MSSAFKLQKNKQSGKGNPESLNFKEFLNGISWLDFGGFKIEGRINRPCIIIVKCSYMNGLSFAFATGASA